MRFRGKKKLFTSSGICVQMIFLYTSFRWAFFHPISGFIIPSWAHERKKERKALVGCRAGRLEKKIERGVTATESQSYNISKVSTEKTKNLLRR